MSVSGSVCLASVSDAAEPLLGGVVGGGGEALQGACEDVRGWALRYTPPPSFNAPWPLHAPRGRGLTVSDRALGQVDAYL